MPTETKKATPKAYNEDGDVIEMSADTVEIVRRGTKIVLPEKMSYDEGIEWMRRKKKEDETLVNIYHVIEAYPLDGAYAFRKAIEKIYGWSGGRSTLVTMSVDHDKTVQVPWGIVEIPGIEGELMTGMDTNSLPPKFLIRGRVKQKHRDEILRLYEESKKIVATESVYRNKAIRVDFSYVRERRDFTPLNDEPKFMDVSRVNPSDLVFEATTGRIIRMTLFSLIEKAELMRQHGVPLKRGVLLAGKYGTGKTMTANVTAKLATDNNWTFIYLKDVRDLAYALRFAQQYAPAVLFAEDIDNVMGGTERNATVNDILNTLDGVDTKQAEILTVLTTNHLERVNPAMLRPGRLDSIVPINEPDSAAAARLIQIYGRGLLAEDFDMDTASVALAGNIPATIRECVERAKAAAIDRVNGDIRGKVQADDVLTAVAAMKAQIALIQTPNVDDRHPLIKLGAAMGGEVALGIRDSFDALLANSNGNHDDDEN